LQRLLDKSRDGGYRGGQLYQQQAWSRQDVPGQPMGQRYGGRAIHQTPQPNHSFGMPSQQMGNNPHSLSNRPETSMWPERPPLPQQATTSQSFSHQQMLARASLATDNNIFYPTNPSQRPHSITRPDGTLLRAGQSSNGRRGNVNSIRRGRRDASQIVSQNSNQPFVPPTSYQVEKIPGYFNSGDEDEADGGMPNLQS